MSFFDRIRRIIWVMVFAGIFLNGLSILSPQMPQSQKQMAALFAIFNCLYCYMTFDRVWPKKEEKNEQG